MRHQVTITILGTTLSLVTEDSEEHLEAVIRYFNQKVTEIQNKIQAGDPLKVAILAGLNAADDLLKARRALLSPETSVSADAGEQELEERTRHMIDTIDKILSSPPS
ncbi:MAG: cell division protein ZapA [Spirochaetaceae bacterium]|nr:MAG: cell division protein ZapA [Spirochaetaceae bacterium]